MIQAPHVNLNGSSKSDLLEQYQKAYLAASKSVDMLRLCAPHGRDYQGLPVEAYETARTQHKMRMESAHKIANDILDIVEQITVQGR